MKTSEMANELSALGSKLGVASADGEPGTVSVDGERGPIPSSPIMGDPGRSIGARPHVDASEPSASRVYKT